MTGTNAMIRLMPRRRGLMLGATALIATLFYAGFLFEHERRAAANLEKLRLDDPVGYLEQIRKLEGFETYLTLFAEHHGFGTARPVAPAFMIGRWTMRDARERISARARPDCSDPITFEYGRLVIPRDDIHARATYRIAGQTLVVAPAAYDPVEVSLVSFGSTVDHLVLQPPGRSQTYYAYPCAM